MIEFKCYDDAPQLTLYLSTFYITKFCLFVIPLCLFAVQGPSVLLTSLSVIRRAWPSVILVLVCL